MPLSGACFEFAQLIWSEFVVVPASPVYVYPSSKPTCLSLSYWSSTLFHPAPIPPSPCFLVCCFRCISCTFSVVRYADTFQSVAGVAVVAPPLLLRVLGSFPCGFECCLTRCMLLFFAYATLVSTRRGSARLHLCP